MIRKHGKSKSEDEASTASGASPFFNRDLSWLEFNARVLDEGLQASTPLLERFKFLCIVSSNFDEFFMVRVASIKRMLKGAASVPDPAGLTAEQQLSAIAKRSKEITALQYSVLLDDIFPALAAEGLSLVRPEKYSAQQLLFLESVFDREVFPTLTPLKVIEGEEFPSTGNLRLHAAFLLEKNPASGVKDECLPATVPMEKAAADGRYLAVVQIPPSLDRILWLPAEGSNLCFALLDDVVRCFGHKLFSGYSISESCIFKVTRDADLGVDEERDEDFLQAMEEIVTDRQISGPVRICVSTDSPALTKRLARELDLGKDDVYVVPSPVDLRGLMSLASVKGFDQLKAPAWKSLWPSEIPQDAPFWDEIKKGDILMHLPYESFDPVIKLLQDAAVDPQVLAIRMTLYRTSGNSPIVRALEQAAEKGKQVTALVELKARFDEEQNINWANKLERAGVIVVYGIAKLKVHAKALLIVRRETEGIKRYVHLSTGNYNEKTARLYTDLAFFTANDQLTYETTLFFNAITGYSEIQHLKLLSMSPIELKHRIISLIDREAKRSTQEAPGLIMAKMNSLADPDVIEALYRASRAGVRVMLNVRGICMLVPGVPGTSENVSVVSIVDRYLEHARMFYFNNGGAEEVYLSSADWMPRNLERRVELMFPIKQDDLKQRTLEILHAYFRDNTHAHVLDSSGRYRRVSPERDDPPFRVQEFFYDLFQERYETLERVPRTQFIVRRKSPLT
jgi:polyphosphate kinase